MAQLPVRKRGSDSQESVPVVREFEVDLLTRENPRAVINLVSDQTQAKIFVAVKERPEFFRLDEHALKKEARPTPTHNRLRLAFWTEFNKVQDTGAERMTMANVYAGVCTRQYFEHYFLNEARNVAWMLCPPASYII